MSDKEQIDLLVEKYHTLKQEISKTIVGQQQTIDSLLISIFAGGHSLLLGVPGLAKTLIVNTLSKTLNLPFKRIQFTPDLMPSDITGSEILDHQRSLHFVKGPLFASIILADEINRTPPKTQAALLEAMQEHSVTVNGTTYPLPSPFFVLATQNPIEQEGTYPLPEAQLDRFMFNIKLDYPSLDEEIQIVKQTTLAPPANISPLLSAGEIINIQQTISRMPVTDNTVAYAVHLVTATRPSYQLPATSHQLPTKYISYGAGPRASQYLIIAARCHAALHGKYSPDIEDINAIAHNVLRHRIVLNYYAEAEGITSDDIIDAIIAANK